MINPIKQGPTHFDMQRHFGEERVKVKPLKFDEKPREPQKVDVQYIPAVEVKKKGRIVDFYI